MSTSTRTRQNYSVNARHKSGYPSTKKGNKSKRPGMNAQHVKRDHGLAWVPVSTRRIAAIRIIAAIVFIVLILRLALVSVAPATDYRNLAAGEGITTMQVQPTRGTIYDSSGGTLAISTPRSTVVADPLQVRNPISESQQLSQILGIPAPTIRDQLLLPSQFVYIAHQITNYQASLINADSNSLFGISLVDEPLRIDPNGVMAGSVIGNVSMYGTGQGGVEEMMNSTLSGKPGTDLLFTSVSGSTPPNGLKVVSPTENGKNIQLTLNSSIQLNTEQSLSAEMVATQARAGVAIMVNTKTGAVVSMANLIAGTNIAPSATVFTPFTIPQPRFTYTEQSPINMATDYVYEPGSVAKIATFAAALKNGVITPQSQLLVPDHLTVGGALFTDAEQHPTEFLSPKEILAQSSNIGTIMIASHLTPKTINSSFLNFGWGRYSGIGLPGESPGFLDPPSHWSGTAPGSVPIGQDEAVTPLAVLDSYAAIANHGVLVTPHLVEKVAGAPVSSSMRRVLPSGLANTMTSLLSGVTGVNATAPSSAVPGFQISGKTGTAQIPYGGGRPGYVPGAFMATFVGFTTDSTIPLAEIVVLTEPNVIYGGLTSAKVFSQTMSYALYHLGATALAPKSAISQTRQTFTGIPQLNPAIGSNCHYEPHRFGASLFGTSCAQGSNGVETAQVGKF